MFDRRALGWVCLLVAACQPPAEEDELQALLHDEGDYGGVGIRHLAATADPDAGTPADGGIVTPPPGGGGGGGSTGHAFGEWTFDDCNPQQTDLQDLTPQQNAAFRAVAVACVAGVSGQAVAIAAKEDIVYVPDQPDFSFEGGLTVAGWFNPTTNKGTRTLIRKRDKGTSSFALVLNNSSYQIVISLGGTTAASVVAPQKAKVGVWQHVAATYDGTMLRLYLDGVEVGSAAAPGTIPPGAGPLLIGNDGSERRFDGSIDHVVFDGFPRSAAEIQAMLCVPRAPLVTATPQTSASTPPGVTATFDIAVTNQNDSFCASSIYVFNRNNEIAGVDIEPPNFQSQITDPVAPGQTIHFTITATPSILAEPATSPIFFTISDFGPSFFFVGGTLELVVAESSGCVKVSRELMITSLDVVEDPVRTTGSGAWTFKHLMEEMAPTPADAPAMVESMLRTFVVPTTLNGFTIDARPGFGSRILDAWPRTADGKLDLAAAPVRLMAIVNRIDLRDLSQGNAGEGRFVFGFTSNGVPLQATIILEYKLPAATEEDVVAWAQAFHEQAAITDPQTRNAALEVITQRFAARGARPGAPNDSAINAVRTNEIDLGTNGLWELREFGLAADGMLRPRPIERTPDRSFNFSETLGSYINANLDAILGETHDVPLLFDGAPFQAGAVFNDLSTWFAPSVAGEARHKFAINTCNGCHAAQETNTIFTHVVPRFQGSPSQLSAFLTGTTVFSPEGPRTFNELGRRAADVGAIVCPAPGKVPVNLRQGSSSRVH